MSHPWTKFASLAMEMMASLAIVFAFVADVQATTPFGIASQSVSNNVAAFATDTSGRCTSLLDTRSSCTVTEDCSPMSTYQCDAFYHETIDDLGGGEYKLHFSGGVAMPYSECGELSCPTCTRYKTCVGPMIQTDAQTVTAGDAKLLGKLVHTNSRFNFMAPNRQDI